LTLNTSKLLKREKNRLRMSVAVENQEIETRNQSLANVYSSVGYSDELFKVLNSATDFGVTRADSFAKDKDKLDYTFKQSFGYTHSFSSNLTLKPTLNFGTSYTQDDITNDINKVYDYSLGLVFDLPKTRFTTNLKVGQNRFVSDRVDDSEQFYFNVTFNYRPENIFGWKTNATVYLKALLNDFNFQTGNRNYRESVFTMGVTIPLDASYGKR